jgi:hypothetical protein
LQADEEVLAFDSPPSDRGSSTAGNRCRCSLDPGGSQGLALREVLFTLVCPSGLPPDWPANAGYRRGLVLAKLEELRAQEGHDFEVIDVNTISEAVRHSLYIEAAATRKRVRDIYGSKTVAGLNFGSEIPCLLIAAGLGQPATDAYPRKDAEGRVITIDDYLQGSLGEARH